MPVTSAEHGPFAAQPATRTVKRRWLRVVLVVALTVLPVVWLLVSRWPAVADGTFSPPSAWTASGVEVATVNDQPGPLRPGDRVVAINGIPVQGWVDAPLGGPFEVGQQVTYRVRPNGAPDPVDVPVTLVAYPFAAVLIANSGAVPVLLFILLVAAYVFLRRPHDRAARALYLTAVFASLGLPAWPFGTQVIDLATGRVGPVIVGGLANCFAWAALLAFAVSFPEPRGVFARRAWPVAVLCAVPFLLHAGYLALFLPTAAGTVEQLARWVDISRASAPVFPFLIAATMIVQYRLAGSTGDRRRMRWVLYTCCSLAALYLLVGQLPDIVLGHPLLPWQLLALTWALFPLVLTAAVLRYRLFDIQFILRRSLVYGTLTVALIAVYVGTVALLGHFTASPVGAGPLLAGGVVAVMFQPLRRWLQRIVSRLFFGDRDDPAELLDRLGRQLEEAATPAAILAAITRTLAQALRLPYVAIELVDGDTVLPAAEYGTPTGRRVTVPLVHGGEDVGRLLLDVGPTGEPFGPTDRRLLDTLAHHIAATARTVTLTARLQRTLGQVITAREEERRRLRRDVHDGIGPVLAAGKIQLQVARKVLRTDPDTADTILRTLADNQQLLITDIRQLVEGLRPPVLDQHGLVDAVRQRAAAFTTADNGGLHIHVDAAPDIEPLPAATEVAAYRIAMESLTNVTKHSGAGACHVRLWKDDSTLHVDIQDNGTGLPASYRAGVGITSIRERATELGGTATITDHPPHGTHVQAVLPLPATATAPRPPTTG